MAGFASRVLSNNVNLEPFWQPTGIFKGRKMKKMPWVGFKPAYSAHEVWVVENKFDGYGTITQSFALPKGQFKPKKDFFNQPFLVVAILEYLPSLWS